MAKIAFVKIFAGMNLPVAQLAGELLARGHEVKIIYFKYEILEFINKKNDYLLGDVEAKAFLMNPKWGVREVDWSHYKPMSEKEKQLLKEVLEDFSPDAIGISTLTTGMSLGLEVAGFIKQWFKGPLLMGGVGPTIEPERAIEPADVVCIGEGESFIVELAERLDQGVALDDIAGAWVKGLDGIIHKNAKRPMCNLDGIVAPVWDEKYFSFIADDKLVEPASPWTHLDKRLYYTMTQRGCPFSCSFCIESTYQGMFGKKDSLRRRSPDVVLSELLSMKKNHPHITGVMFFDDVFTLNPRWLEEFLPKYKELIGLPFWCYTYPSVHTKELLQELYDAGCRSVTMGVQSGSERLLKEVFNRPTKVERIIESSHEIVDIFEFSTMDFIPVTEFDMESDLISTFEMLMRIPQKMKIGFYNRMAYFPGYKITDDRNGLAIANDQERISKDMYFYYLKLFNITRTDMPREDIWDISRDIKYKNDHALLNQYLNATPLLLDYLPAAGPQPS
ncbi:MAG TPA: radical SAM protein [Pseudomonadales bacterium]